MDNEDQSEAFDDEGPITTYVRLGWDSAWKSVAEGKPADGHILSVENFLSRHRAQPQQGDTGVSADLDFAESLNRFHAAQYWHHLKHLEHRASQFQRYSVEISAHNQALNLHLFRSLTLAHGAAIVATLAYLGNTSDPGCFPWILFLCGVGFLFSLLAARLSLHAGYKALQIVAPLTFPLTPESETEKKSQDLIDFGRSTLRYEWPIWVSVGLLIGALTLGTLFLLGDRASLSLCSLAFR
ncbi:hypothetical protein [Parvibaculum sp.]|uniref:hypothetical protein n=1 Tax=Parvibaculum sp. TaxID=2024848 RepID=UPI001D6739A4|nr:hypothetical protein [Parvibaculum sp.]MBX3491095.1 hypothetical protein [Parvibaculum sp.]MCW5728915.1 hypothetical protein [Parvibaculum sp.]